MSRAPMCTGAISPCSTLSVMAALLRRASHTPIPWMLPAQPLQLLLPAQPLQLLLLAQPLQRRLQRLQRDQRLQSLQRGL